MSSSTSFGSGTFGSGPLGTAPFFSVKDLVDGILYATAHANPTLEVTKRAAALQFLNNTYQEICMGKHWAWMFATYDVSFYAPNSTGNISLVNNSDQVTGDITTLFSANDVKGRLVIPGISTAYNVKSVESPTSLTLETPWAEPTTLTPTCFKIYVAQYKLPAEVDQVLSMSIDDINLKMVPVGTQELRIMQQRGNDFCDTPRFYSRVRRDVDDDGSYIEVYPLPDRDYSVHLDYSVRILKLEDDPNCYPIIPDRYRVVLFYGALAQFYRYTKNETAAQAAQADYGRTLLTLQNDTQLTDSKLKIKSARNYRNIALTRSLIRRGRGITDRWTYGRDD